MKNDYKTKPRNAIIGYLRAHADTRFTARDIYSAMHSEGEEADRSTIYRNLERLCKEGLLVKYKETDVNATCYQYTEGHGSCLEHMHAQCAVCGRIFHLDNSLFDEAAQRMQKEYGVLLDYGRSVIICRCRECSEK